MDTRRKVVAVASGGGHWVELLRVMPAFEGCDVHYVTVNRDYQVDIPDQPLSVISDATRWSRLALLKSALQLLMILLRERPDVVVTTGAAPGYLAIRLGRLLGARTIWLDSIANADELSLSGRMAGQVADLWLTQWPHLAGEGGPQYFGGVL